MERTDSISPTRSELGDRNRNRSQRSRPTVDLRSESTLRWTAGVLSVLGLLVAGYISLKTIEGGHLCSSDGCKTVLTSDFSKLELNGAVIGIHWFGLVGYLSILVATLMGGDRARLAAFGLSFFGFGVSITLFLLQATEIGAFCPFCLASGALMTLLFVTNSARASRFLGTGNRSSVTQLFSDNTKADHDQEVLR